MNIAVTKNTFLNTPYDIFFSVTLMFSAKVMRAGKNDSSVVNSCRENGEFEEEIVLPSHSRLSPPEGEEQQQQEEQRVPVIAFTENGLLKPLSGVEDISVQQGPGK